MASINTIVKRKQYLWLGIVVVGTASAIGGALYLSDVDMSGNGETVAEQEPVPDMTGVVDTTFDDKVRQHATTEMQVTAAQMQKQYEEIRRELDVLNKQRGDDQRRIEKLGQDNAALAEQVKALGANPVTATGEPVPQTPASPPGPEGEPQPGNTPVSFPPQGSVAVPPPTAFYPGNGVTPPPQVTYQSVPVPNRIQRKVFTRNEGKQGPSLPYIPSGSFAKAMLIEGADANASVTGNESTVPMQLRITGLVEMPNSKTYDATGCFVGLEAWGDVSSERAIVRTRNIPDSPLCFVVQLVRFVLCHFTDNFIRTAFRFTADGLFSLPLCQHLCRYRFAISGPRLDTVVRNIPPHATAGDGTGIPRTTFTGDSHHHTAVRIITGNPDAILHVISQQTLSVTAALQGHELRIPAAFHPSFTTESPQPVSVIRGQWVQPDTC